MMTQKRNNGLRIARRILICLLVLLLIFTLAAIIIPQYSIWKQEHEREQVAISWLENVRLNVEPTPTQLVEPSTIPSVDTTDPMADSTEPDIPDVNPNDIPYTELYEALQAYNKEIFENGQSRLNDAFSYEIPTFDLSDWGVEDDIFGVISIPKIDVVLPVYLGATYQHMANGFAQMSQTSVPIGGVNTNTTLACHRGWRGMAYLRDVEMIEIGDSVYVHNLWEDLEYRVVDIYVIEPSQTECLKIQEGRDLLTIFTCHPYRVSTHRYVLVCERYIPDDIQDAALDIKKDIIDEVTTIDADYITSVIKGVTITMMDTTDGNSVESSQPMIFWTVYFPWMLLVLILVCMILYMVYSIVCFVGKRKRRKVTKMFKIKSVSDNKTS